MKQRSRLFGNWVIIAFAFIGLLSFTACEHDLGQDDAMMYTISGNANGTQVLPAVTGTGTGTITGTYNQNTNILSYTITYNGLSRPASSGYLYSGMPGSIGSTNRLLSSGTVTNTTNGYTGQIRLNRQEEEQLLNGTLYYAVVTTGLEIGGKITAVRQ